jgi:hypothetical protein
MLKVYWCYEFDGAGSSFSPTTFVFQKELWNLLLRWKDTSELLDGPNWVRLDEAMIVGIQTSPIFWRTRSGTKMFGIRLKRKPSCNYLALLLLNFSGNILLYKTWWVQAQLVHKLFKEGSQFETTN